MGEQEGVQPPEISIDRWGYKSHFEPYLVEIAEKKRNGVESITHFPRRIELSREWHRIHEQMREETKDKQERWTPIAFRDQLKDIYLPQEFLVGSKHHIPTTSFSEELANDYLKLGITTLVGDIHSHPGWGEKFVERFVRTGRIIKKYRGFSPGDMFRFVEPDGINFFIFGVVGSKANYYAFITKETKRLAPNSKLSKSDEFQNYWFYEYTRSRIHENFPITYPKIFSLWDVNLGFVRKYNIALYQGKPGGDLVRAHPS